jgi:hypothetical protein
VRRPPRRAGPADAPKPSVPSGRKEVPSQSDAERHRHGLSLKARCSRLRSLDRGGFARFRAGLSEGNRGAVASPCPPRPGRCGARTWCVLAGLQPPLQQIASGLLSLIDEVLGQQVLILQRRRQPGEVAKAASLRPRSA